MNGEALGLLRLAHQAALTGVSFEGDQWVALASILMEETAEQWGIDLADEQTVGLLMSGITMLAAVRNGAARVGIDTGVPEGLAVIASLTATLYLLGERLAAIPTQFPKENPDD